jgi:hypothetical protein
MCADCSDTNDATTYVGTALPKKILLFAKPDDRVRLGVDDLCLRGDASASSSSISSSASSSLWSEWSVLLDDDEACNRRALLRFFSVSWSISIVSRTVQRPNRILARFGVDEFTVVLVGVDVGVLVGNAGVGVDGSAGVALSQTSMVLDDLGVVVVVVVVLDAAEDEA